MQFHCVKARYLVLLGAIACLCLALAACSGSGAQSSASSSTAVKVEFNTLTSGKLKVATCANNPIMEYQDGDITGFDIDLIKEIGRRLGVEVSVSNEPFDSLVASVDNGDEYDCAVSDIEIIDRRAEQVNFTEAVADNNLAIVIGPASTLASSSELAGHPVGAQVASYAEEWVAANLEGCAYTPFQEVSDIFGALSTGSLAAAVVDESLAQYYISSDYSECKIIELVPTGRQSGIVVNKENAGLLEAMNTALADMRADGTYEKLYKQWFKIEL